MEGFEELRLVLVEQLLNIQSSAGILKSDDVVDDEQVDAIVTNARHIAEAFNTFAKLNRKRGVAVPKPLEPSPYQAEDYEDDE